MLKFDPLDKAEIITGKSSHNDESTVWLGMALGMDKNSRLNELLNQNDDTFLSNKVDDYIRKIKSIGFEEIYFEPFACDKRNERMFFFFQREFGILLRFDTFDFDSVNSGKFYYNWSPNVLGISHVSSGSFINGGDYLAFFDSDLKNEVKITGLPPEPKWDMAIEWSEYKAILAPITEQREIIFQNAYAQGLRNIWVGDHDCREAVKHNIHMLATNGKFAPNWKKCAFSWLCNYSEFKKNEPLDAHYESTKKRLSKFPKWVLDQIGEYPH